MPFIKASGNSARDMVGEFKFGKTVPISKVIGEITKPTAKGDSFTRMEMFMKVNG